MRNSFLRILPTIASVAVGVIPVAVLIAYFGVPRKLILGWGILSYVGGVALIKLPLYRFCVVPLLHPRLSHGWLGCSQGILSATAELGSAALFFLFLLPDLTLPQLLGFAVAAGSVEAIVLPFMGNPFHGTPLEHHTDDVLRRSEGRHQHHWLAVMERILASVTHTTTRGLIYIALITANVLPAAIAFLSFAAVDGMGYYAHLEKWPFDQSKVALKFYRLFFAAVVIQSISFLGFYAAR